MTTLPEEAVKAENLITAAFKRGVNWAVENGDNLNPFINKAARDYADKTLSQTTLPFLTVQVAVKKLEWFPLDLPNTVYAHSAFGMYTTWEIDGVGFFRKEGGYGGLKVDGDLEAAKAAAQADYEARVMSALEPSAARELALEEAAQVAEKFRNKDWIAHDMRTGLFPKQSKPGIAIAAAIRALSSPDHADAGKVEGVAALDKALELTKRAKEARGRAYRRTPGTNTFLKEWNKADAYEERAKEQFAIVRAALASEGAE
ncbi:hypothetical protein IB024_01610 [Brucella sp. 6810]|uniref:hypothetical protein n=1 Tax=Brucella sp. 6810 TaxID=2769351 RepID=UPI00165BD65E|nr:hypothetical protein [Brucella sp. 6810]QNQ62481.1 hypothetical protein IB024_01610 [Brucella sp. 6810]